jgi:hypothetical protein
MLAEILANPVAWPLWAVLVFAASMYPLGFMLPGCVCCGGGNCTQCGLLYLPYGEGQNDFGRMCCNAGTKMSSITVRITNVGPATSTTYVRGTPSGGFYSRRNMVFNCASLAGDYVFFENGNCDYGVGYGATGYFSRPYSDGDFPGWRMWLFKGDAVSYGISFQTCSGFPGVESCGTPTFSTTNTGEVYYWPDSVIALSETWYGIKSARMTEQMCDLRGLVFGESVELRASTVYGAQYDTGCRHKLEVVA